ncbi:MAG: hypothetical protein D6736_13585 [Nitrospinota bacterium]|nr:MAG: hypothetical protein D6736_13585 [Nitrospinota bacterium]
MLLLLDEPFAGVHPRLRDQIIDRLLELHERGHTFIVVDHNMDAIQKVARRLVVMARGEKIADGPPEAVLQDQEVIAAYTGG